jgi:hypothetical protein
MRQFQTGLVILAVLFPVLASAGQANHSYKWVKDDKVSSQGILDSGQAFRLVPMKQAQALELVRKVMSGDLCLSLAEFNQAHRQQEAETTLKTILPEEITKQEIPSMASEDYCFILDAKLKADGDKTRITLVAIPVYRVDTAKAANAGQNVVEIKIKTDSSQVIGMGPIFVMPTAGQPTDFNLQTLPDAADRAAMLVRSFVYYLDQKLANKATP